MYWYEKAGFQWENGFSSHLTVRYGETDQMGFLYYGRYLEWFEVARVDWLKSRGISYRELEANGVFLPVVDVRVKYYQPNRYDDLVEVKTWLSKISKLKISFQFALKNQQNNRITTEAEVVLASVNEQGKPSPFSDRYFSAFQL